MTAALRGELRLLWRGFVVPVCLVVCALFAIANVANEAGAVRSDYALVQHTRAEYRANGLDFDADLAKPAKVVTNGDEQTVSNLARYDYDTMAAAIVALSPASSVEQALGYFAFVFFPVLFFLVGLWMSTVQRRYRVEKVTLTRAGPIVTVAARQLALLVAAAVIVVSVLIVDVVSRAIATTVMAAQLPFSAYPTIGREPSSSALTQWAVVVLVTVFFGAAGIATGDVVGVFALPAIVFVIWDLVVPFLGPGDPRDWFVLLAHSVFTSSGGFHLSPAIPLATPVALSAAVAGACALAGLGYVGIRLRNPMAT